MRKLFVFFAGAAVATAATLVVPPVFSQFRPDAAAPVQTVAAAKRLPDDSWVTLEGHLVRQLRGDHYLFRDASGDEVTVEIEHDRWGGLEVGPGQRVRIAGEVDRDWLALKIEVKRIEAVATGTAGAVRKPGGFQPS